MMALSLRVNVQNEYTFCTAESVMFKFCTTVGKTVFDTGILLIVNLMDMLKSFVR